MACKRAENKQVKNEKLMVETTQPKTQEKKPNVIRERLLFGVDSKVQSDDLLQNNITEFEWAVRNKIYPNFWGRNIVGENALSKKEIGSRNFCDCQGRFFELCFDLVFFFKKILLMFG